MGICWSGFDACSKQLQRHHSKEESPWPCWMGLVRTNLLDTSAVETNPKKCLRSIRERQLLRCCRKYQYSNTSKILTSDRINWESKSQWLNGEHVVNHTGGHLPFSADVTRVIRYGKPNLLVVAVNNTLTETTIPQGTLHQPTDRSRYSFEISSKIF